jgi:hypothetical protein
MGSPTPRARWRVVSQSQQDDIGADGRFIPTIKVTFEVLDTGTVGSISIPASQFEPGRVAEAIQNRAQLFLDVARLGD